MSEIIVAWQKGLWGKTQIYPQIESQIFQGVICLFDPDEDEQIFIHRDGEKVYYVYLWRLSRFDYISLGLLTNKLCSDYDDLQKTFRTFVKNMADNNLCVYITKEGKIKLSSYNIQKQPRQRTLLDINIKELKNQFAERQKKWDNLPPQKLGILKSDIVPCILGNQDSLWIVTQVTSGYRNVCISIRDEIKPSNRIENNVETKHFNGNIDSIAKFLRFLPRVLSLKKSADSLNSLNTTNRTKQKKHVNRDNVFARSAIGGSVIFILWFISTKSMWLTLVATIGLGIYAVRYTLKDNHKGKYISTLGWIGILLSTILTIYEIYENYRRDLPVVKECETFPISIQSDDEQEETEIKNEGQDFSKPDCDNDLSGEKLPIIKKGNEKKEKVNNDNYIQPSQTFEDSISKLRKAVLIESSHHSSIPKDSSLCQQEH